VFVYTLRFAGFPFASFCRLPFGDFRALLAVSGLFWQCQRLISSISGRTGGNTALLAVSGFFCDFGALLAVKGLFCSTSRETRATPAASASAPSAVISTATVCHAPPSASASAVAAAPAAARASITLFYMALLRFQGSFAAPRAAASAGLALGALLLCRRDLIVMRVLVSSCMAVVLLVGLLSRVLLLLTTGFFCC